LGCGITGLAQSVPHLIFHTYLEESSFFFCAFAFGAADILIGLDSALNLFLRFTWFALFG
jgi:hypothetical protein